MRPTDQGPNGSSSFLAGRNGVVDWTDVVPELATADLRRRLQGRRPRRVSRPYILRHLFCSLLLAEGASVVEVARQAGHSPAMTLSTYGHVIEELEGADRRSAEDVITAARDAVATRARVAG